MSSIHSTTKSLRSPVAPGDSAGYDRFIDQQVEKTGTQVKLVDVGSSLAVLGGGVLSYLLAVTVTDHWIVSLGTGGRWAALVLLAGGAGWYMARFVVPVLFGRVNPLFAARAIEHSEPSLKNSLINFLLFRSDRAGVRGAVYQALEQRAATDLKHVPVDTAVDRSRLIKLGYFLAAVLAICAAYTILAPRSPFQSVARVLAPWADIERPSRVRIEEVEPGSIEVFQGERIVVSAHLYDVRRDEPVTLYYAGLDEQLGRQSAVMQSGAGNLRYESALPSDDDGFQRDVMYWIEAGDARTAAYRVHVIPAPVILVESIEYAYPQYTKLPQRVVERQGDIRAVEGTRVTVRARANQPIAAAVLEFDPPTADAGQTPDRGSSLQSGPLATSPYRMEMQFLGQEAWCSFVCELDEPRTGAKHRAYQMRFATESGHRNPLPVLHRIEVLADLAPEVEILTPSPDRVEVPEDGWQKIEIRAVDPDYGLTAIRLEATAGGRQLLKRDLLQDPAGRSGQEMASFEFAPRALGMRAGTEAQCWAVAEDNRTAPLTGSPEPNVVKSRQITLVITSAENTQPAADGQQSPDAGQPEQGTAAEQSDDMADDGAGGQPADSQQAGGEQANNEQQAGGDQQGGESGQASPSDGASGQAGSSAGQGGTDSSQAGGETQNAGGSESAGGTDGSQDGAGTTSGQPGTSSTQGSGSGDASSGGGEAGGADARPGSAGGESQSSEPLHDGEAFEKAMQHLQQAADGQGQSGTSQDGTSQDGAGSQTADQGGRSSAGSQASDASTPESPSGDGQQSDAQPGDQPQPAAGAEQGDRGGEQPSPDGSQDAGQPGQETPQPGESAQEPGGQQGGMPQQSPSGSGQPKESGQNEGAQSGSGQPDASRGGSSGGQNPDGTSQKQASSGGGEPRPSQEPQAPSMSRKASGGQGDAGGDQSGGAKQGGGQSGNQPGNDSPGGTTPGDQGAGASQESGGGELASRRGDKQQSPDRTGESGYDPGDGSGSKPAAEGAGGSGAPGEKSPADRSPGTPQTPSGEASSESGQGQPRGGGDPGSAELGSSDTGGEVPPGEQPNLDYARRATDMVLEYLKDQESRPDEDLLNKLGWTQEDLRDFVQRWSELKRAATEDPRAQRDLDDALRSLGLRPATAAPRRTEMRPEARQTERNLGTRSNPPAGYRELFDAYRKGTGRVGGQPDADR
jgi:hypothetical protein